MSDGALNKRLQQGDKMAKKSDMYVLRIKGEELHGMHAVENLRDILEYETGETLDWVAEHQSAEQALLFSLEPDGPTNILLLDASGRVLTQRVVME